MPTISKSTNIKNSDVIIVSIPYDKTSSFGKGSDKGPNAIINCLNTQIELYERNTKWNPSNHLNISANNIIKVNELAPEDMVEAVSAEISKYLELNKFIISIGGEHSISIGIFDAWSKTSNTEGITIVQFDAHLDLRDDDSDYNSNSSRFAHSCVMKRAVDMGYRIIQIGARAYADFELKNAIDNNVKIFEWPREENSELIKDILKEIKTKKVYLTLDVDGIDPSHMPATGTPVQGGLSWGFTLDLLKKVFENKEVIGADIVEVAPIKYSSLTEYGAAQLLYYLISLKFKDKFKKSS